ncbi:hypothetical protein BOX15_Mlig004930g5, partial [Macrostomum lignano]
VVMETGVEEEPTASVSSPCPISCLIKNALNREPLSSPVDAMPNSELQSLGSLWSADLLDCVNRLVQLLSSSLSTDDSSNADFNSLRQCPATQVLVHLFASGCALADRVWSQPALAKAVISRLYPLLPPLAPNSLKYLDFQPALAVSDEPGCVPFSTASLVQLLCNNSPIISYPVADYLSPPGRRHAIALTTRLCSHHCLDWQLLGLDCLSAGLLTSVESHLARDLLHRLSQSRDAAALEPALNLSATLRALCPEDWLLDRIYLDCLQCLSYECRPGLQLARLKALPVMIDRLGMSSIKYGSLVVKCLDNCLSRCDSDIVESVWLVLDSYLRYCLFERHQIARILINFAMHNPLVDCGRHLPAVEPQFVGEVCRGIVSEAPELQSALSRYMTLEG